MSTDESSSPESYEDPDVPDGTYREIPAWFDVVEQRLDEHTEGRKPRHSVGLNFPPHWHELAQEAAAARDMSLASYSRRATMAFVAHDFGMDYDQLMQDEPAMRGFGVISVRGNSRRFGQGFGRWVIEKLRGEP